MNHFIEYICRSTIRSEDAICRLNKRVSKLARGNNQLCTSVICIGVAGLLLTAVVAAQDKEIKALQKQVADLTKESEATENTQDTTDNMEEQTQQEGA